VLGITAAGTYTIGTLNPPLGGVYSGQTTIKRAAFVRLPAGSGEADGVWVEFIGSNHGQWNADADADIAHNYAGLFLRREEYLIDATRQRCDGSPWPTDTAWKEGEMVKVTLNADQTFLDQTSGLAIGNVEVAEDGETVTFSVAFVAGDTTCYRGYPRIAPGLFGEYYVLQDGACTNCDVQSMVDDLKPSVAGAARKGFFRASQVEDTDTGPCGSTSTFASDVVDLPSGWSAVNYWPDVQSAGIAMWAGSTPYHNFHFALNMPSDAADGDYDMCVLVYNMDSGLQTARPFRVTLPESNWVWWQNNRPDAYDPLPANDCSQHIGCRAGISGCSLPVTRPGMCTIEASDVAELTAVAASPSSPSGAQGTYTPLSPSPLSPSPLSPPPSPPSAPPPLRVVIVIEAAGDVSDYDTTRLATVRQGIASAAGVPPGAVEVAVSAGSVILTATISVPSGMTSNSVSSSLAVAMPDATTASSLLAVTVTATPTIAIGADGSSGGSKGAEGIPTGAVVGIAAGGVMLLAMIAIVIVCRARGRTKASQAGPAPAC